ncbi:MAG TPA: proteasome subunit beta, partial [Trebonia sp.]|nr:proteasome subunit beta [Trebonia sp.]
MNGHFDGGLGQAGAFMTARIPSFTHFLATHAPDLLPASLAGQLPAGSADIIKDLPHATTIVAAACERGVVLAGDRRATAGNMISKRDVEKVFRSDE